MVDRRPRQPSLSVVSLCGAARETPTGTHHPGRAAGWRLERVLTDNGQEFRGQRFRRGIAVHGVRISRIHPGRPQTNGAVETVHKTILDECWRPAFARYLHVRFHGLKRELERYLSYYNNDRAHTGRLTRGRVPADLVYGARKMELR
ncbi:MAG: transposase family protein [Actinobacteria bacterium]|nr:MAG: transposase family protein [Actinomycetota bacterium]